MPKDISNQASARYQALHDIRERQAVSSDWPKNSKNEETPVSKIYGENTFGLKEIQSRVAPQTFQKLQQLVTNGGILDRETANSVANAVKDWAIEKGVTHFAHWFQPMTGSTAEKHDAFISLESDGTPIEKFTGSMLVQGEPDASSFPSGGSRTTFEARGYTAWDVSSPMFILEGLGGWKSLCIPSAFVSYTGECLDKKTPLLRSMRAINDQAIRVLRTLGDSSTNSVKSTVGAEQEYFLIDRSFYQLRPDLVMSGRTLMGSQPQRGQQLDDHYFGSIPNRVGSYMREVDLELYKMGVPAKTRHNEVAPSQFELAPIFVDANVAADHNQIIMETLRRVAYKHNFSALVHEKPFAEINGTGKHVNWSMSTDSGDNLLEPGETPSENLRFITFLSAILWGIHKHAAIVRSSIATHGNDFRLGANEAPPAIISAFLGETLTEIVETIEKGETPKGSGEAALLELGISNVPNIPRGNTDRNRTSPFAFTGNKFEFRAVGGSQSISWPITLVQVAVGDGLRELADRLEAKAGSGKISDSDLLGVLKEFFTESRNIRFEGNGYSEQWITEAESRGLPHLRNTPAALSALRTQEAKDAFSRLEILSEQELEARHNVRLERYIMQVEIEANALLSMINTMVIPAARDELQAELDCADDASDVSKDLKNLMLENAKILAEHLRTLYTTRDQLKVELEKCATMDEIAKADYMGETVMPLVNRASEECNAIEDVVSDSRWPLPKYREMLFIR
jgi:glutamine synthetase